MKGVAGVTPLLKEPHTHGQVRGNDMDAEWGAGTGCKVKHGCGSCLSLSWGGANFTDQAGGTDEREVSAGSAALVQELNGRRTPPHRAER